MGFRRWIFVWNLCAKVELLKGKSIIMKNFGYLLLCSAISILGAKELPIQDMKIHIEKSLEFGKINAKMIRFGGYTTPECKLAISNDGLYFYLSKVNSTCTTLTNSKGIKIICNTDKSVCKTRKELIDFVTVASTSEESNIPSWCSASKLNKTEHTICANEAIGLLDKELIKAYGTSRARDKDVIQREWLKKRNRCGNNIKCIKQTYKMRIADLQRKNNNTTTLTELSSQFTKEKKYIKDHITNESHASITDSNKGLMWQDNRAAKTIQKNWKDAMNYCKNLSLLGYSNWRLPYHKELKSILDNKRRNPAIKKEFKNVASASYWATEKKSYGYNGVTSSINFKNGNSYTSRKYLKKRVRCVRYIDNRHEQTNSSRQQHSSYSSRSSNKYTCKFHCEGQFNVKRGGEKSTKVVANNIMDAEHREIRNRGQK
jgi:uncharacterized protein